MNKVSIVEGIIIGGVGGFIAGVAIWLCELARKEFLNWKDTKKVEKFLKGSETPWRSTRSVAAYNNLTEDRIRFICSYSSKIKLNSAVGNNSDEKWAIITENQ